MSPLALSSPHILAQDFLDATHHDRLLAWAVRAGTTVEESLTADSDGSIAHKPDLRRSRSGSVPPELATLLLEPIRGMLPEFCRRFRLTVFKPVFEMEFVAYGDGDYFRRHIDTGAKNGARMISAVYYMHRRPRRFTGGALRLFSLLGDAPISVEPDDNSLAVFPSIVPHDVTTVHLPGGDPADARFAINLWLHHAGRLSALQTDPTETGRASVALPAQ